MSLFKPSNYPFRQMNIEIVIQQFVKDSKHFLKKTLITIPNIDRDFFHVISHTHIKRKKEQ